MNLSVLNSLCYTVGWFWCVLFGVDHRPFLALFGALLLIAFQLYYTKSKDLGLYIQDLILVVFSVPLGTLLEMILTQTGFVLYHDSSKLLPPIWIVCLYPLFTLLLNHSLRILRKSTLASFLFGFVGAPLSYLAGVYLGAITLPYPLITTWFVIGICWGLFLCFFMKIGNTVEKATKETLAERDSKRSIELLYDGECPLCKREICILQKKDPEDRVKFTDISSKNFSPAEHNNIDYNTAMSQIHAIENKGNLLVGITAFAAVYARCQLLVLSTLLRIPIIKWALNPLYTLFANNRLWITGRNKKKTNN